MVYTLDRSPTDIIAAFTQSAPVDVHGIARELGLTLEGERLPDDISGKIEKNWVRSFTITYNLRHSPTRQRFTIAHEIAHFVLHRDRIGDGITDDGLYRSTTQNEPIEREANAYAAVILMPAPLVRRKFQQGVRTPAEMATTFQVSPEVARIRLRELRLT